jgi:hypothetical protein
LIKVPAVFRLLRNPEYRLTVGQHVTAIYMGN